MNIIFSHVITGIFINFISIFSEENNNNNNDDDDDDDNGAVQGPIPLEPDEKLYGQKQDESKIRQL